MFACVIIWKLYLFSLLNELMAESPRISWQFLEQRVAVKAELQGRIIQSLTLRELELESVKVGQIIIFNVMI